MEEYYLRFDKYFWARRGRKTLYPSSTKVLIEIEKMSSVDGGEVKYYYAYIKDGAPLGQFDEEEFKETFMDINEMRDRKIDDII